MPDALNSSEVTANGRKMLNARCLQLIKDDVWLSEASAESLSNMMSQGEKTSYEIVLGYLQRIARYDKAGVKLNSILEVNPDALFIAGALDAERKRTGPRGPLHGVPVILKDNIDTGDKMHTSAGSVALEDSHAPEDSFLARSLRDAGAVILGKANMTEWANFISDHMPNGYSSRGGQVLNPYGPGRFDVGGSSAGTGVAVAACLATVGVGTETSGSVLNPSSNNSLVGLKPTVGLVSRTGIIPISHSQDTAGPMCRTVRDTAMLLGAMTGVDQEDPATWASEGRFPKDYTEYLDKDGLRGTRIGVARWTFQRLSEDRVSVVEAALSAMEDLGAVLVDLPAWPVPRSWTSVLVYEFKVNLNAYLKRLEPKVPVHSLKELIEFNRENSYRCLRYGQVLFEKAEATGGTLTEPDYIAARLNDLLLARDQGIDKALKEFDLDAVFFPQIAGAGIAAKAGYPSITVPAGYTTSGSPVAIMFAAGAFEEPTLLRLAYAFEQATHARRAPTLN